MIRAFGKASTIGCSRSAPSLGIVDAKEDAFRLVGAGGAQQVDPGAVAIIDLGVEFLGPLDLRRVDVDQRHRDPLGHQHLRDGLAEPAVADHDGIGFGAELGPRQVDMLVGLIGLEPADEAHKERGRGHRGGDYGAQELACSVVMSRPAAALANRTNPNSPAWLSNSASVAERPGGAPNTLAMG